MGSYFTDKWDALSGIPAGFAEKPLFLIIAFAIGLPLIWWKWRATGGLISHTLRSHTYGPRADGDHKQMRHDTGIGIKDVLVMRPGKLPKLIYFGLFFFGGGLLFYLFVYMPSDLSKPDDWWTVLGLSVFTIAELAVIEMNQTRFYVDDRSIQKRRVLHRRQSIAIVDIAGVKPHAGNLGRGLVVHRQNGEKMRILPTFSGYRQLVKRLEQHNFRMDLSARMLKLNPDLLKDIADA